MASVHTDCHKTKTDNKAFSRPYNTSWTFSSSILLQLLSLGVISSIEASLSTALRLLMVYHYFTYYAKNINMIITLIWEEPKSSPWDRKIWRRPMSGSSYNIETSNWVFSEALLQAWMLKIEKTMFPCKLLNLMILPLARRAGMQ